MKGRFVVLEGIDGSGTSTQSRAVADALRALGRRVTLAFEPTDLPIGKLLRAMLRGEVETIGDAAKDRRLFARLFAADRAHHLEDGKSGVHADLARGVDVVCARYVLSSYAYEGETEDELAFVRELNRDFTVPDLTIYLDCSVQEAMKRIGSRSGRREVFENEEKLARVRRGYETAIAAYAGTVLRLDATRPPAELTAAIVHDLYREA